MKERKLEKFNIEKEPIIDIETSEEELERWKELKTILEDTIEGFDDLVERGDKFVFHPANFELTSDYLEKDDEEELDTEEKIRKKVVLNYVFKELEFDLKNPKLIKEETSKTDEEKITIKYFETNQPNIILGFDGIDWWIEKK